jgi:hypothetical protein
MKGRMGRRFRRIDDSVLVSADALLSHFVHTVHEQQYRLVVDRTAIFWTH